MFGGDLRDQLEGLHHAFTFDRGRLGVGIAFQPVRLLQLLDRQDAWDVALVELDDDRRVVRIDVVLFQIFQQVGETLARGVDHRRLRVRDEDDGVRAFQNELARLVVEDLPRHGVQLDLEVERADAPDVDRQQTEEERAIGLRGQRQHLPFLLRVELVEDDHEVGRFSAQTGTVVDDLGGHLAGGVIEKDHRFLGSESIAHLQLAHVR